MKIENKEDSKKIVELNEKEQLGLFCAAMQLTNLWEYSKECIDVPSKDGEPIKNESFNPVRINILRICDHCKYHNWECIKKAGKFPFLNGFETIEKLTGVIIHQGNGDFEKASFLNKDYDYTTRKLKKDKISEEKEIAQESEVQEQPIGITVDISNGDELVSLINEITSKLKELNNFKLKVNVTK